MAHNLVKSRPSELNYCTYMITVGNFNMLHPQQLTTTTSNTHIFSKLPITQPNCAKCMHVIIYRVFFLTPPPLKKYIFILTPFVLTPDPQK